MVYFYLLKNVPFFCIQAFYWLFSMLYSAIVGIFQRTTKHLHVAVKPTTTLLPSACMNKEYACELPIFIGYNDKLPDNIVFIGEKSTLNFYYALHKRWRWLLHTTRKGVPFFLIHPRSLWYKGHVFLGSLDQHQQYSGSRNVSPVS